MQVEVQSLIFFYVIEFYFVALKIVFRKNFKQFYNPKNEKNNVRPKIQDFFNQNNRNFLLPSLPNLNNSSFNYPNSQLNTFSVPPFNPNIIKLPPENSNSSIKNDGEKNTKKADEIKGINFL
jgi:hypothetical protein